MKALSPFWAACINLDTHRSLYNFYMMIYQKEGLDRQTADNKFRQEDSRLVAILKKYGSNS